MQLLKMKKETLVKLGVGGAPSAIGNARFVVEKATERQTSEKTISLVYARLPPPSSSSAARRGRFLSITFGCGGATGLGETSKNEIINVRLF